eukprot:1184629-Prorocentrum_minimum.AAC.1
MQRMTSSDIDRRLREKKQELAELEQLKAFAAREAKDPEFAKYDRKQSRGLRRNSDPTPAKVGQEIRDRAAQWNPSKPATPISTRVMCERPFAR